MQSIFLIANGVELGSSTILAMGINNKWHSTSIQLGIKKDFDTFYFYWKI